MEHQPHLDDLYSRSAPYIARYLSRAFPRMCPGRVEDAIGDTYVALLERPDSLEQAWARGGEAGVNRLLQRIAWRQLRGQWRRKAYQLEEGLDAVVAPPRQPPGQELVADYQIRVGGLLDEAAWRFGRSCQPELKGALVEKLQTGDSDTQVAQRCGVRREYLNRAKNWLADELLAA